MRHAEERAWAMHIDGKCYSAKCHLQLHTNPHPGLKLWCMERWFVTLFYPIVILVLNSYFILMWCERVASFETRDEKVHVHGLATRQIETRQPAEVLNHDASVLDDALSALYSRQSTATCPSKFGFPTRRPRRYNILLLTDLQLGCVG